MAALLKAIVFACLICFAGGKVQFQVSKVMNKHIRMVALWLAAHKYFEVDRRKGNELIWKYEPRVYFKHFPIPRLRKHHPQVETECSRGVWPCLRYLSRMSKISYTLHPILFEGPNNKAPHAPFSTPLALFQFRTTASYYMCWHTLFHPDLLADFMDGQGCLTFLEKTADRQWVDYDVIDNRIDSPGNKFQCAEILFCPNPCFGRKTLGSVKSFEDMMRDVGNPCRHLQNRWCAFVHSANRNFEGLKRNQVNISCDCNREKRGFEWFSKYEMCVDKDDCEHNAHCTKGRQCENTVGSYECLCPRGQRFDGQEDMCVEHYPLPKHRFGRTGKVRAYRQESAFMRFIQRLFGV